MQSLLLTSAPKGLITKELLDNKQTQMPNKYIKTTYPHWEINKLTLKLYYSNFNFSVFDFQQENYQKEKKKLKISQMGLIA